MLFNLNLQIEIHFIIYNRENHILNNIHTYNSIIERLIIKIFQYKIISKIFKKIKV